ncbi:MFS transporter (plasmid) [Priestia megaterium]|uniref:MFS transporter n=1 Tax=Priestia megaterium TaxID=1404 RepID=UPI00351E1063
MNKLKEIFIDTNFFLLLSSRFVSQLGDKIFLPAVLWLAVESSSNGTTKVGILSFVIVLPTLLSLFIGVFVDRFNKKNTMILCDLLRFLFCLFLYFNTHFWFIVAVVFLIELIGQFFNISSTSSIPSIVSEKSYLKANSYLTGIENITSIVGYSLGGLLIGLLGIESLVLINSITFLVSSLLLLKLTNVPLKNEEKIIKSYSSSKEKLSVFRKELLQGSKIVFTNKMVTILLLTIFILNISTASLEMLITVWAHDILKLDSSGYGFLLTSILIGSLIGSFIVNLQVIKRLSPYFSISFAVIFFGVLLILLTLFKYYLFSLSVFLIIGIFFSIININFSLLIMKNTPEKNMGKVFGLIQTFTRGGHPIGITLVTGLLGVLSVIYVIIGVGIVVLIGGVFLMYSLTINSKNQKETNITMTH